MDPGGLAGDDIGFAAETVIGQQAIGGIKAVRQRPHHGEHRLQLFLVVGGLGDPGGQHQQGVRVHQGLGIVALLETATRERHDPGVVIR